MLFALITCFQVCNSNEASFENYTFLDYSTMRSKLQKLHSLFPDVVRLDTAENKYDIPYHEKVKCGTDACVLDIVTVTDHLESAE